MAVDRVTDDVTCTVGLVGVSSYQGWQHMVGGRNANTQAPGFGTSILDRFTSTFTFTSPLAACGYSWNGHTALLTRKNGRLSHVVGFNPKSMMLAGAMAMFTRQFCTTGEWYDDTPMVDDPTAVSFEIPVGFTQVDKLDRFLASLVGRSDMGKLSEGTTPYSYTFKPGDQATEGEMRSNCGHAALKVLCRYLAKWGMAAERERFESFLARDKNVSQGGMMKAIGQGFR